jgi:tRNA1(Val) A37 N6-methylase TrmN6
MARSASRLKLGYYPLVPGESQRIRRFLEFPTECAVLDPCAGKGAALRQITSETQARRYGIELDSFRAREAGRTLDEVVQGSVFDTHCPVESYSLLYLNPPLS